MPFSTVEVGDVVLTPHGEMTVVEIDNARELFIAQGDSGLLLTWPVETLEEMRQPKDLHNHELLEQWLRCAAEVVPSLPVQVNTVRCIDICKCRYCYRVERIIGSDPMTYDVEVHHMTDSGMCLCVNGCTCIPSRP